jgi:hypothetical protein
LRYDGHAWTHQGAVWPLLPGSVTWAADGTAWVLQCAYRPTGEVLMAHYDGSAWVEYTSADGLPGTTICGQVVATAHGVYVGTGDGLYRLVGDRRERVWPPSSATPPASTTTRPVYRTMTTVVNGRVLLVGIEVDDQGTGRFSTTGLLATPRTGYAAVRLADGRFLILGGTDVFDEPLASAEIWDPTTGTVRQTGSMMTPRAAPVATLLGDGRVLVEGGDASGPPSAELYDPVAGTFSPVAGR